MKTTLELPDALLHKAKAVALRKHTTMRALIAEALTEKLNREQAIESAWRESSMPPPPAIAKTELRKEHKKLLEEVSLIYPEDWK